MDGQANRGMSCPSGHSDNFCAGWKADNGNYTGALAMNALAISNIGRSLLSETNYTGAVNYFNQALSIEPNHVNALDGKATALIGLYRYAESLATRRMQGAIGVDG